MDEIEIDEYGYAWIDGLKVFRLTHWGLIEFYDRDRIRSERRGSKFVYVTPCELGKILSLVERISNGQKKSSGRS